MGDAIVELTNRTAIVTGSGSGIGRALALAFAREGANVVCCARRKEKLDETVALIENGGGAGLAVATDITQHEDVKRLVETTVGRFGSVDILFNNAGSFRSIAPVSAVDPQLWWQDVTVNLLGCLLTTREVLPLMIANNDGIIVNMNGGRPVGGSGYACGKAGVMELTRLTAEELKQEGSSVMVFSAGPGLVRTEMTELQAATEAGRKWIPSTQESFDAGRTRAPEEIAEATIRLVKAGRPEWSGRNYGPDTDFDSF